MIIANSKQIRHSTNTMTYSVDFRKKILLIKARESLSFDKTALRFGIAKTTIVRWVKDITIKTKRNKPATKIDMEALAKDVKQYPDSYLYERAKRLTVSNNTVLYALRRLNVTYKKNSKPSKEQYRRQTFLSEEHKFL